MKKFLILILTLIFALTFAFSMMGCKDKPSNGQPSEEEDPVAPDIDWESNINGYEII